MEELDNRPQLYDILVSPDDEFKEYHSSDFPQSELPVLSPQGTALYENAVFPEAEKARREVSAPDQVLYERYYPEETQAVCARFVPYFLWGNRNGKTPREMQVWFHVM